MKSLILIFILCISHIAFSQTSAEKFIKALINNSDNIRDFVDESEIARSERLGITYTGVKNKFLIGYDIDEQVKSDMKEGRLQYDIKEKALEDNYSQVEFSISSLKFSKLFYFHNGKFISPTTYLTRNWQTDESKYFIFKISEPKYFNDYCVKRLDEFVDKIADTLNFSEAEKVLLQQQKIYYIFCKDEDEVQALTGYKSKGQAILAFDEVITAYQTHFHELSHLLINYKLKNLGLYTLPFFMEGFAVAMGGRGGMAPRVVTDVGYYLQKTAFLTYDSILTYDAFSSQDANMTYAISGLYNMFLFNELGASKYLELYKKVNGDLEKVKQLTVSNLQIPEKNKFLAFLDFYDKNKSFKLENEGFIPAPYPDFVDAITFFRVKQIDENFYYFNTTHNSFGFTLNGENIFPDYTSRLYNKELYNKDWPGSGEYVVVVDSTKLKLYNCLNDEIEVSYDINFSTDHKQIPVCFEKQMGGELIIKHHVFSLAATLFDSKFDIRDNK